jgi:hypothetical protein
VPRARVAPLATVNAPPPIVLSTEAVSVPPVTAVVPVNAFAPERVTAPEEVISPLPESLAETVAPARVRNRLA